MRCFFYWIESNHVTQTGFFSNSNIVLNPNPVTDNLTILLYNPTSKSSILIYYINGTEVYSSLITNTVTQIDMSSFATGIYIVKIVAPENGILTKKIIKQ